MNRLHFCGGLPRAGSTVLMNILQQNPKIFTTGTCALADVITDHVLIKSRYRESFQAMSTDQADSAMYGMIHGATKGWFEGLTNKPTVISKNRSWSNVFHLYKKSKYVVMVRDLRDIVDSFERLNNRILALHPYSDSNVFVPSMHVHEKMKYYFSEPNSLSVPLQTEVPRLMEVFGRNQNNVMFIRYEDFTSNPIETLKDFYNFIEEDWYEHDLNNIDQSELFEHDHAYFRERTEHKIKSSFQYYKKPERVISQDLQNKIVKEFEWFYKGFYPNELTPN